MKNSGFVLLFALTTLVPQARAGVDISGGGNAVVCFTDRSIPDAIRKAGGALGDEHLSSIVSIEAFDFYEAKHDRGVERASPATIGIGKNENEATYIERIAQRFDSYVPAASALVRDSRRALEGRISFEARPIGRIDDMEEAGGIDKANCVLATTAENWFETDVAGGVPKPRVRFDSRLMEHSKHSMHSRAVLQLHELVYVAGRSRGHESSAPTRSLIFQLITRDDSLTIGALISSLKALGFAGEEAKPYPEVVARQALSAAVEREKTYSRRSDCDAIVREELANLETLKTRLTAALSATPRYREAVFQIGALWAEGSRDSCAGGPGPTRGEATWNLMLEYSEALEELNGIRIP